MVVYGENRLHFVGGQKLIPVYHLAHDRSSLSDVSVALDALLLDDSRNVITVVGGAAGADATRQLAATMNAVVRAAAASRATLVYGGTDSGVLAALGEAVGRAVDAGLVAEGQLPLVALAALDTLEADFGDPSRPLHEYASPLQPGVDALITTPGQEYGDESPYIAGGSAILSRAHRSATVVVNGGEITRQDADNALAMQNPQDHKLFAVLGSGRAADAIAQAQTTPSGDPLVDRVAANPRTQAVTPDRLEQALTDHLGAAPRAPQKVPSVPELDQQQFRMSYQPRSARDAYFVGRMHGAGYGPLDARNLRLLGRFGPRVRDAVHSAWVNTPKSDRHTAIDGLKQQVNQHVQAMPDELAYRVGVRVGYWGAHDGTYDRLPGLWAGPHILRTPAAVLGHHAKAGGVGTVPVVGSGPDRNARGAERARDLGKG